MDKNKSVACGLRATSPVLRLVARLALAVTSVGAPSPVAGQAPSPPGEANVPTVSGMRAHLFRNKTGQWSDDILGDQQGRLWNTIAGPNSANATLVVVEVSGPPGGTYTGYFGPETKYSVRLVAREGQRRLLLDQAQVIPVLNDQGKVSLAFLVRQSGCAPVRLTASIIGARPSKPLQRSLNFACGE
jgi:hypothetical protein